MPNTAPYRFKVTVPLTFNLSNRMSSKLCGKVAVHMCIRVQVWSGFRMIIIMFNLNKDIRSHHVNRFQPSCGHWPDSSLHV
ncbi:hypothetical protein GDO86_013840 [Hymenochirus boettgeri]|uniref:Uncharacterized protein n=1 Tax=Hymenochirus boettgeri TaxID=247094 RepID=A0A8T2JRU7_9PIPI|nr:hypothetical protein GDO86_013840 [Hymenochirus boettgeri]